MMTFDEWFNSADAMDSSASRCEERGARMIWDAAQHWAKEDMERVAWRWRNKDPKFNQAWSYTEVNIAERGNWIVEPLYARPPLSD